MKITKAIIPAAGFATRFLPVTKALPKVMLPIVDKPAIHYLVEESVASGINQIIIVTGQNRRVIEDYFNRSKELEEQLAKTGKHQLLEEIKQITDLVEITYVTQAYPLGLGHAVYCARERINKDETFAILLGDDIVYSPTKPCLAQLIEIYHQFQANIIGVQAVPHKEVSSYGIVKGKNLTNKLIKVEDLVEKPDSKTAPSNIAILGRYLLHWDIFGILENTRPGKGGEIQLTDALKKLNQRRQTYACVFEGERYDLGDRFGYLKATIEFSLLRKELRNELKDYMHSILSKSKGL